MTGRPHLSTTRLTSSDNGLWARQEKMSTIRRYRRRSESIRVRYAAVREDCVCAQNIIKECRHAYNW